MSWSKYICLEALFYTSASRLIRRASAIPQRWIRLLNWWPPPHPQTSTSESTSTSKFDLPGRRNLPSFSPNGDGVHFPISKNRNFFCKILWIGLFTIEEKFAINRKISHFSNFLFNSELLYIWACKSTNFQTKWRRWKWFQ